jgi:hypothetical protein
MVDSKELAVKDESSMGGKEGILVYPREKHIYISICVLRRRYGAVSPLPPLLVPSD